MEKILIAYYSKTGSTKNTGEYIQNALIDKYSVDLKEINTIKELDQYSKVILGAPINGMQVVPQMKNFIDKHHENLRMIPTYFYAMTYAYNNGRNFVRKSINKEIKNITLPIQSKTYIIGGVADKPMPKFLSFLFGIKENEPLDNRNFDKINELINQVKTD